MNLSPALRQALEACPFCGGEGQPRTRLGGISGAREIVGCPKCGTDTKDFATEAEAIAAWNTRTGAAYDAEEGAQAGGEDPVGCAERQVGRYIYKIISARMDAKPGTPEAAELDYLATIVSDVEEYGADEMSEQDIATSRAQAGGGVVEALEPFAHFQWNSGWGSWEQVVEEAAGREGVVAAYRSPRAALAAIGVQGKQQDKGNVGFLPDSDGERPSPERPRSDGKGEP